MCTNSQSKHLIANPLHRLRSKLLALLERRRRHATAAAVLLSLHSLVCIISFPAADCNCTAAFSAADWTAATRACAAFSRITAAVLRIAAAFQPFNLSTFQLLNRRSPAFQLAKPNLLPALGSVPTASTGPGVCPHCFNFSTLQPFNFSTAPGSVPTILP